MMRQNNVESDTISIKIENCDIFSVLEFSLGTTDRRFLLNGNTGKEFCDSKCH